MERVFVDTNLFLYALDADSPHHRLARSTLADLPDRGYEAVVSPQILFELYAQLTHRRTGSSPLNPREAAGVVAVVKEETELLAPGSDAVAHAFEWAVAHHKRGTAIHDAALVGCMKEFGIRYLLSADSDFRSEGDLTVINPLKGQHLP